MEASQRSEVNKGMHDAMWRGHGGLEMAVSPLLFGFGGWFVDGWLDTRPVFTIIGAVLGLVGSVCNQYFQYTHRMKMLAEERAAALAADSTEAAR